MSTHQNSVQAWIGLQRGNLRGRQEKLLEIWGQFVETYGRYPSVAWLRRFIEQHGFGFPDEGLPAGMEADPPQFAQTDPPWFGQADPLRT